VVPPGLSLEVEEDPLWTEEEDHRLLATDYLVSVPTEVQTDQEVLTCPLTDQEVPTCPLTDQEVPTCRSTDLGDPTCLLTDLADPGDLPLTDLVVQADLSLTGQDLHLMDPGVLRLAHLVALAALTGHLVHLTAAARLHLETGLAAVVAGEVEGEDLEMDQVRKSAMICMEGLVLTLSG
jgi:hypothetical protein